MLINLIKGPSYSYVTRESDILPISGYGDISRHLIPTDQLGLQESNIGAIVVL